MNSRFSLGRQGIHQLLIMAALTGLLTWYTESARAQPPREPILRIETGTHFGSIEEVDVDAADRYLVTSGSDKTIRVWELPSVRLMRTIRPFVGDNLLGDVGSIAISPDGQMIAAVVLTDAEFSSECSIYLYERASGRVIYRLPVPHTAFGGITYSKDGRYLAAIFGGDENGLRVFDVSESKLELVGEEEGKFTGVDFDFSGRLVATTFDGSTRLFARVEKKTPLRRVAEVKFDKATFTPKFSPDGSKIVIAMGVAKPERRTSERPQLKVLSGSDLQLLYSPDLTNGVDERIPLVPSHYAPAWSYDGMVLYAIVDKIRVWTEAGKGAYSDIPATDSAFQVIPLRSHDLLYLNTSSIRLIDRTGISKTRFAAPAVEFPGDYSRDLLLSEDGGVVQFSDQTGRGAYFSVNDRLLGTGLPLQAMLPANKNGEKWGVAASNDGQMVLKNHWSAITLSDKDGKEIWRKFGPAFFRQINIPKSRELIAATLADGTIRWYRLADGKELLVLFPHSDLKRWVLWTPSGYYDASPGGEDLIGWHVNNGKDAPADFFPAGKFRSTYYRPDVIAKILDTGNEARALQLASEERGQQRVKQAESGAAPVLTQMLPPVVEIASPVDGSTVSSAEVTIRYSLRLLTNDVVTSVRVFVDGRPVSGDRQLVRESGLREVKVTVPQHDSEVSIIAENKFAASVPATVRLKWRGPATTAFLIQPKLYVLAIGVSQYQNPSYSLNFAAKDAQDFASTTILQKGLYRDVVTKVLTNEHATKDEILDGLDWIRKETTSKDVAMVFFAGHGLNDQNGVYYFLPYNTDLEKLLRTGVAFTDVKNTVQSLAGKTILFIDTCHSGNMLGGRRGLANDLNGVINELASAENGAVVFAASTGNQSSLEDAKWNNGAFSKALVEGFMGSADYTGKGKITINMLDLYISERVKELTGGKQTPTTAKPQMIPDYPIAFKRQPR